MQRMIKIIVNYILPVIVAGLALFGTIKSCNNEKKINAFNYRLNANQFRPQIIAKEPPVIDSIYLEIKDYTIGNGSASAGGYLHYNATLTLENIGNTKASIGAVMFVDTLSFRSELRKITLGAKNIPKDKSAGEINRLIELLPEETYDMKISRKISYPINQKFNIHILVFYINEMYNFFDSYFWYEYEIGDHFVVQEETMLQKGLKLRIPTANLLLIDSNKSSKIYNKNEILMWWDFKEKLKSNSKR